jgi:hypothetical protein
LETVRKINKKQLDKRTQCVYSLLMKMNNNAVNYFKKAKQAARNVIEDTSAAHAAAIMIIKSIVPNKPDAFYADMGWQAVLAAREGLVFA